MRSHNLQSQNRGEDSISSRIWQCLIFGLLLLWFGWIALERLVSGDEGFYLYAAKLMASGQQPYHDFFFPQMRLVPFIYALVFNILGESWTVARLFTSFFPSAIGLLLYMTVEQYANRARAILAVLLFCTSVFVFPWYSVVQTYPVSVFLLFSAVWLLEREQPSWRIILCSGLCFGLAVEARLFFIALLPLFLFALWRKSKIWSELLPRGGVLCFGVTLALLPSLVLFLCSPESFQFSNLGYHLARSESTFGEGLSHRWKVLQVILGLRESVKFSGVQLPLLIWTAFFLTVLQIYSRRRISLYMLTGAGLFLLNFIPDPTYVQYFCTVVPFLLVGLFDGLEGVSLRFGKLMSRTALAVLIVVSLISFPEDLRRYTQTGDGVLGISNAKAAAHWKLKEIEQVVTHLQQLDLGESTTVALWPGYLVGTSLFSLPGFENQFTFLAARTLNEAQQERYHVVRLEKFLAMLRRGVPDRVIGTRKHRRGGVGKQLRSAGYTVEHEFGIVKVYRAPQP